MTEYEAAADNAAFFDRSDQSILEIAGPDAREFLHNLCTQDVKNLPVAAGCEAFVTTSKARIVAHVGVAHRENNVLWLDVVPGQADTIAKHLNHFLISERAEIADRTGEFGMLRIIGPRASERLVSIVGSTLDALAPWQVQTLPNGGMIRRQRLLGLDGFDLFAKIGDIPAWRQRLVDHSINPISKDTYNLLRIEAGLPEFGIDMDENRLAMEVNRPQAISYKKGCYLGQETIVMARDRGQVNRLFMGVKVAGDDPLRAGTKLYRNNEEVGQVTSSAFSSRLRQVNALAYLRRGSWDAGTEVVIDAATDGRTGVVCALPFAGAAVDTVP
jgi:folate-binding protein YgfZ